MFDKALATKLAQLVNVAYASHANLQLPMPAGAWVIESQLYLNEWGQTPFGFVASLGTELYVVCRGTVTVMEWLDDSVVLLVPCLGGKCCWGFKGVVDQLLPQIRAVVNRFKATKIYLTGHSLGGACATLLQQYFPAAIAYSFCSPRVGDPALAQWLGSRIHFRCHNSEDAVAQVPFAEDLYMHTGTPIEVTFNGRSPAGNHDLNNLIGALNLEY